MGSGKSKVLTYENGLLVLLGFTFGIVFFERNAIGPLAAYIIKDLSLSQAEVGLLGSGLSLAWAVSAYCSCRSSCSRCARRCPASPPRS